MACCYCCYGKTTSSTTSSGSSSSSSSSSTSSDTSYLSVAEFAQNKTSIQRQIAQIKVDDIAQNEQIEELQQRVNSLQEIMLKVLGWVDNTCGHCGYSPAGGQGAGQKSKIIRQFLPFDLYRQYLIGDPSNDVDGDPPRRGYRTDKEIEEMTDVKPPEIKSTTDPITGSTGVNYISQPAEADRLQDRKSVVSLFMNIGNEGGSGQSDLSELTDMVDEGTDEEKSYALDLLVTIYSGNVSDTNSADNTDGD